MVSGRFVNAFRSGLSGGLLWRCLFCLLALQLRQLRLQHGQLGFE